MFLSSQQGRLRVDDGHAAIAPSLLTSEHTVLCPSTDPTAFSLGLLGFFLPPTHPAVVNRTGHWHAGCCVFFLLLVAARPG